MKFQRKERKRIFEARFWMTHKTDHDRQSIDAMKLKLKHASTSTTTSDDDDVKIVTNCSLIAIGICDIAGAGCRALKALCSAEDSKCVRREFELEFVTSSDLRAAESDVDDDDSVELSNTYNNDSDDSCTRNQLPSTYIMNSKELDTVNG